MQSLLTLLFPFFLLLPISSRAESSTIWDRTAPGYQFRSFDIDLDGAIDLMEANRYGGRVRLGLMEAHDELFYSAGLSLGRYTALGSVVGVEGEILALQSGLWFQPGLLYSSSRDVSLKGSIGWSLIGMDLFVSPFSPEKLAVNLKIRVPLRLIFLAL